MHACVSILASTDVDYNNFNEFQLQPFVARGDERTPAWKQVWFPFRRCSNPAASAHTLHPCATANLGF